MNNILKYLTLVLGILVLQSAFAQDFTASLNKSKLSIGEPFTLTYKVVNRNVDEFRLPKMPDFKIIGGPFQQYSQSISNNRSVSNFIVTYNMIPLTKGKYIIGGASVKSGNQTLTSNALEIEVSENTYQGQQNQPNNNQNQNNTNAAPKGSANDMFLQISTSKSSVYAGDQVLVTYKLYSKYNEVRAEDFQFPDYKGVWIQEIKDSGDKMFKVENYNGQRYYTAVIQKNIIIPQNTGIVEIGPFSAKYMIQTVEKTGDLFQDFFNGGRVKQFHKDLKSNTIKINVKELPQQNKPDFFGGAVGDLKVEANIDRTEAAVNDAFTVKVKITGNGNLMLLDAPVVIFPESFEKYDPKINDKISVKEAGISGTKTIEYIAIPRSPGTFDIPGISFACFIPSSGTYKTYQTEGFKVTVSGNASSKGGDAVRKQNVDELETDIRYIKQETKLKPERDRFFLSALYIIIASILLLLNVLFFALRKKVREKQNDEEGNRIRKADSVAVKRLKLAAKSLSDGKKGEFYEEIYKAMLQYLSDKTGLQAADYSKKQIRNVLTERNVENSAIESFISIIEKCELARFAPPAASAEMANFYDECVEFINRFESKK